MILAWKEDLPVRHITTTELFCMEVINLCDGGKLGYPSALEICAEDGRISAIIIPKEHGFLGFGKSECYHIPWCRIECLGEDAILVKLTASDLSSCLLRGGGKKR